MVEQNPNIPDTEQGREKWLEDTKNRDSVKRIGSGSIYYKGALQDVKTTEMIVTMRHENVGQGLAHFGGLSEPEDQVPGDDLATGINSAAREGTEEMEELLNKAPNLDKAKYKFLYTSSDDNFLIKNGYGFAIDSRLHAYPVEDDLWEDVFPNGATRKDRHPDYVGEEETAYAEVTTIFNAMARQNEYFYMHEYFALFVMAAKMMNEDVMTLVDEVNAEIKKQPKDGFVAKPNQGIKTDRIDFNWIAKKMHTDLETLENHLGPKYKGKIKAYEAKFK